MLGFGGGLGAAPEGFHAGEGIPSVPALQLPPGPEDNEPIHPNCFRCYKRLNIFFSEATSKDYFVCQYA